MRVGSDAALDISRGRFGLGVVVRDHEGKVRAAQSLLKEESYGQLPCGQASQSLGVS